MYRASDLSSEERKYLSCGRSFADYAAEVEDFSRTSASTMLQLAMSRSGATDPGEEVAKPMYSTSKYHWALSGGKCGPVMRGCTLILSSTDFKKAIENGKRVCKYCASDFQYR